MLKASIIIPYVRPHLIDGLIEGIKRWSGLEADDYEIIAREDKKRVGCPPMVADLTRQCRSDNVMFLGDDTMPEKDFLKTALDYMQTFPDAWGVVGLNDGLRDDIATHWLAHKKMLPYLGGTFFHPGYFHCFCDNELTDIATSMGRYIFGKNARIRHNHPFVGKAEMDVHYERVYAKAIFDRDQELYIRRRRRFNEKKDFIHQ